MDIYSLWENIKTYIDESEKNSDGWQISCKERYSLKLRRTHEERLASANICIEYNKACEGKIPVNADLEQLKATMPEDIIIIATPKIVPSCMEGNVLYVYPLELYFSEKDNCIIVCCDGEEHVINDTDVVSVKIKEFYYKPEGKKGCIPCRNCGACSW